MATKTIYGTITDYNNALGDSPSYMQIGRTSGGSAKTATVEFPAFSVVGTITSVRMYFQWNNDVNGIGWSGTFTHRITQNGHSNDYTVSGDPGSANVGVTGWSEDGWTTVIGPATGDAATIKSYLKSVYVVVTYTPNREPNQVTSVSASPSLLNAGGNITVNWNNPGDPDGNLAGFEIAMQYPDGSWYGSPTILKTVGVVTSTTIDTDGWSSNKTWHFKVRAFDSYGVRGDWSSVRSAGVEINGIPYDADNFRFNITNKTYFHSGFTAYWDNNGDPNGNLQKFYIMLYKYSGGSWSAITGWIDKGLSTSHYVSRATLLGYGVDPGDYIGFDIKARDTLGYENTAALHGSYYLKMAGDPTPPGTPSPSSGIFKDAVTFLWSGAEAGVGASISRYDVAYLEEGGSWVVTTSTDTQHPLDLASLGVPRGNYLQMKVRTVNNFGGVSAYSGVATVYRNQLPIQPSNIGPVTGVYPSTLALTWTAGSDPDSGQTIKYKIEIWSKPTGASSFTLYQTLVNLSGTSYNYTMAGLPHGEYKARIYSVDSLGEQSASYAESPVYRPYGDPTPPTSLIPASGIYKDAVTFSWSGAGAGAGAAISRYDFSYSINGGAPTVLSVATASQALNLVSLGVGRGQSLAVKVRTISNFDIPSDWSEVVTVYRNRLPVQPSNILPAAGTFPTSVDMLWTAGTDADAGQSLTYKMEVWSKPTGAADFTLYQTVTGISSTNYIYAIGGKPIGEYKMRLYSVDSLGEQSAAYIESPIYKNNQLPGPITTITPASGLFANQINFSWNSVTDPDGDDVVYELALAIDTGSGPGEFFVVYQDAATSYSFDISGEPRGRRYYVRVTAVDSKGGRGISKTISGIGRNQLPVVPVISYPVNGSILYTDRPHMLLTIPTEPDNQIQSVIGGAAEDHKSTVQTTEYRPSGTYNAGTKVIFRPAAGLDADLDGSFAIPFKCNDAIESGAVTNLSYTWNAAPFTDEPFTADTYARKVHVDDARTAINALRTAYGIAPKAWAYTITANVTKIRIVVLYELRSAIDDVINKIKAWNTGVSFPEFIAWSNVVVGNAITKAHIEEIHQAIRSI